MDFSQIHKPEKHKCNQDREQHCSCFQAYPFFSLLPNNNYSDPSVTNLFVHSIILYKWYHIFAVWYKDFGPWNFLIYCVLHIIFVAEFTTASASHLPLYKTCPVPSFWLLWIKFHFICIGGFAFMYTYVSVIPWNWSYSGYEPSWGC